MTEELKDKRAREETVKVCRALLNREIGVVETARILSRLRFDLGAENESDFLTFVGIDSETDHLPIGEIRKRWNRGALLLKDQELANAENFFLKRARDACENLIKKYSCK